MSGAISSGALPQPTYVPYMDLSGGLNTRKDSHALARNQLAKSSNCWYGSGNALSKRPGSVSFGGNNGLLQSNGAGIGLTSARFNSVTYAIAQAYQTSGSTTTTQLSYSSQGAAMATYIVTALSANALPIQSAQMYDPETGLNSCFIVDGVDVPQVWTGPPSFVLTPVNSTGTHIPFNHTNTAPITPKFVETAGFYLLYAGEPTEPCAVYISNPFFPQIFNLSATTTTGILANPYIPYLVGFNDGVQGGDITGIKRLPDGSATGAIMVYKQNALYRMNQTGLFAEMYWGSTLVSSSIGCLSPRSIVAFDTFHVFLGTDGVYTTDGSNVQCVSANVPTYFDSTLSGVPASIFNRTTAVAVRNGQRYMIWFDVGTGANTVGLWFDFGRLDEDGLPTVGEIDGMTVGGAVSFRGPADDGNFVWLNTAAAAAPRFAKFGVGFSDLGAAITTSFAGKADLMEDVFGPEAPMCLKDTENVWFLLSAVSAAQGETLTFTCAVSSDLSSSSQSSSTYLGGAANAAIYGTAIYGQSVYGGMIAAQYAPLKVENAITAQGHSLQFAFSETSAFPWTCIGFAAYVNAQKVNV